MTGFIVNKHGRAVRRRGLLPLADLAVRDGAAGPRGVPHRRQRARGVPQVPAGAADRRLRDDRGAGDRARRCRPGRSRRRSSATTSWPRPARTSTSTRAPSGWPRRAPARGRSSTCGSARRSTPASPSAASGSRSTARPSAPTARSSPACTPPAPAPPTSPRTARATAPAPSSARGRSSAGGRVGTRRVSRLTGELPHCRGSGVSCRFPGRPGNPVAVRSPHDRPLPGGQPGQRAAVPRDGPAGGVGGAAAHPRRHAQPAGRAADDRGAGAGARGGQAAARLGRPARLHAGGRASSSCARRSPATTSATHGIDVDPDEVVVTTGSSGGFLLAFLAAFEVGDRVAMARPGYPCYRNVLTALGCEVVEIPTGPETRFQPTVEQLAGASATSRGSSSPARPTPPARCCSRASWPRSRRTARSSRSS